jgi:uncharacterized protein (TIGR04255 family)
VWDRYFRERFPQLEERLPVEEISERFGEERLAVSMARWQMIDRPVTPRLWAASEDGRHVVQIQRNAFFSNWLKTADNVPYCPYSERRQEFANQLAYLQEFFHEQKIGQIEPTSWSVTYINHIDYAGLDCIGPKVAEILTVWTNQFSDDWLSTPDNLVLNFAFPMPNHVGRLNVNLVPIVLPRGKEQALRLDLTARGQLQAKSVTDALDAIDMGHEWIVRGFASLTRPEMHQQWGREE